MHDAGLAASPSVTATDSKVSALSMILFPVVMVAASVTRKYRARIPRTSVGAVPKSTGRRTTLPSTCPDNSHVGLMTILYNNIGKHAPLPPLACGLPAGSFLRLPRGFPQVKTWLGCPCPPPLMSPSTCCRGCVRSWSTASCWTPPTTQQSPTRGW